MKYKLKVYDIWEQGPREKQEDSMFPAYGKASEDDRLFILCDGMGGHSAGEVASSTVCEAMGRSILSRCPEVEGGFTDDDFRAALADAYDALDRHDNGAAKKMGTTLTFLKLHDRGVTIAHMGDSRVYHIRPGQGVEDTEILFQTEDHSLVNDLVKVGELTREEAKSSKQKNVITRAMQPCMERRPKADIYHTHDIRPGDYFMLCSDGMLEQMEDDNLKYIFSAKGSDAANKVEMLIKVTNQNHDNHSAIIVRIADVEGAAVVEASDDKTPALPEPLMAVVEDAPQESQTTPESPARGGATRQRAAKPVAAPKPTAAHEQEGSDDSRMAVRRMLFSLLGAVVIAVVMSVGYYLYKQHDASTDVVDKPAVESDNRAPASVRHDKSAVRGGNVDRTSAPETTAAPGTTAAPAIPATPAESETSDRPESAPDGESAAASEPESAVAPDRAAEQPEAKTSLNADSVRRMAAGLSQTHGGDTADEDVANSDQQTLSGVIGK